MTDPISDYLTRIRNAQKAGHKVVAIPASTLKRALLRFYLIKVISEVIKFQKLKINKVRLKLL